MAFDSITEDAVLENLHDAIWRIENLYTVVTKEGRVEPFSPTPAQAQFLREMHGTDIILKARQLGFSTLIEIILLDSCMFHNNISAGIITITEADGIKLLKEKIRDVYERLPQTLKDLAPIKKGSDSATLLGFTNGSTITVGISLRGGTYQLLHVSELGKISARFPARAEEIKTGAFNTIADGQHAFIESTAEGEDGLFFEMCEVSIGYEEMGLDPDLGEFKIHFFPWFMDDTYRLKTKRPLEKKTLTYFKELSRKLGLVFDRDQMSWYQRKWAQQGKHMTREFPSTPEEAFAGSIDGAIFPEEIDRVYEQQRIGRYPFDASLGQVFAFWDIGVNDLMVIWLAQQEGPGSWRFFDCISGRHRGFPYYARILKEKAHEQNFVWGAMVLPHDGGNKDASVDQTRAHTLENLMGCDVIVVPRTPSLYADINLVRPFIDASFFDISSQDSEEMGLPQGAGAGFKMLKSYKWKWSESHQSFTKVPDHDTPPSHYSDAYRTAAAADRLGILDELLYGGTYEDEHGYGDDNMESQGGY